MSRRKPLAVRKPCGRISSSGKTELISPAEVRRLVTAAANGMRSAEWSSSLGRLLLVNKIEPAQYSAGRHWAILVSEYSRACQSPAQPRSIEMDRTGGTPADVGSVVGEKEAKRHEKASKDYVQGRDVLRQLGPTVEQTIEMVVERDLAPVGFGSLEALRTGLSALSAYWSAKRKAR